MATKPKPSAAAFASSAVTKIAEQKEAPTRSGDIINWQLRLDFEDAERFRSHARRRKMSIQSALVEAVNLKLAEWNEPPIIDVGASKK